MHKCYWHMWTYSFMVISPTYICIYCVRYRSGHSQVRNISFGILSRLFSSRGWFRCVQNENERMSGKGQEREGVQSRKSTCLCLGWLTVVKVTFCWDVHFPKSPVGVHRACPAMSAYSMQSHCILTLSTPGRLGHAPKHIILFPI